MPKTEVYVQGLLEPILLNEPIVATGVNMGAAANANMRFFQAKDENDELVMIAIPLIMYMREVED